VTSHDVLSLWLGGTIAWLYLAHFCVQSEGEGRKISLPAAVVLAAAWPLSVFCQETLRIIRGCKR